MTNKLLEFIFDMKKSDLISDLPEIVHELIDYQSIIAESLSEEYRHPLQKEFIYKEIQIDKPTPGRRYSWLGNKSMEYISMKYHLYDHKLKKGYYFDGLHLKRGSLVSVLNNDFIELLPEEKRSIVKDYLDKGTIPFYYEGNIYSLSKEYFRGI